MRDNTGGLAFPIPVVSQNQTSDEITLWQTEGGMSLRDYFAAKAMAAYVSSWPDDQPIKVEAVANFAYRMADAMLAKGAQ